ncbi:MAG: hypothetical protein M3P43_09760 [Actinomycetota bacterium]|nr:hypothetical protein [Actinomycetota bacterium]
MERLDPSDVDADVIYDHDGASARHAFTEMQTRAIAALIGLDLNGAAFDVDMFRRGLDVELEHGRRDPETNVTDDDPLITGKIAWAHLKELPDYYDRLKVLETGTDGRATATRRLRQRRPADSQLR